MSWIAWVVLPLPLLSLATLVYALMRRDAQGKERTRMVAFSSLALLLGLVLVVLAALG